MHPLENPNPIIRRSFLVLVAVPLLVVYMAASEGWDVVCQFFGDIRDSFIDGWDTLIDRCSYIRSCLGRTKVLWDAPGTPSNNRQPE